MVTSCLRCLGAIIVDSNPAARDSFPADLHPALFSLLESADGVASLQFMFRDTLSAWARHRSDAAVTAAAGCVLAALTQAYCFDMSTVRRSLSMFLSALNVHDDWHQGHASALTWSFRAIATLMRVYGDELRDVWSSKVAQSLVCTANRVRASEQWRCGTSDETATGRRLFAHAVAVAIQFTVDESATRMSAVALVGGAELLLELLSTFACDVVVSLVLCRALEALLPDPDVASGIAGAVTELRASLTPEASDRVVEISNNARAL